MRIDLDTQRALYAQHAAAAVPALIEMLRERGDELVALGARRAFEKVGVHEYGDSTYWLDPSRLAEETLAELADAIFYQHIEIAREAGALGVE